VLTQPYKASRGGRRDGRLDKPVGGPLGNCGVRVYTDTLAVPPASAPFHRKMT
jgi:hypothetical protein